MGDRTVPALLRREKLLVRLVAAFIVMSTVFGGGLLWVASGALDSQQDTRKAATARIDKLTAKLDQQNAAALVDRAAAAADRAELRAKVDALFVQVQQLCDGRKGCVPVASNTAGEPSPLTSTTTATTVPAARAAQPSSPPANTTTTTTAPPPSTTPTTTPPAPPQPPVTVPQAVCPLIPLGPGCRP